MGKLLQYKVGTDLGLRILNQQRLEYKEKKKKLQISIHILLKNYKYTKSLFLNTLRCNHLLTKTKNKKQNNVFFLILGWLGFFFCLFDEVRAFTVVVLKFLAFSISKNYFIYFIISLYNTPNIKYSIFFFIISFKII